MENHTLSAFDYFVEFKFDENDFKEFSVVGYRQCVRMSAYILLLYIGFCLYNLTVHGVLPVNPVFHAAYLFFTVVVYFINRSRLKNTAAKETAHWSVPYRQYRITFGDNISVTRDGTEKIYLFNDIKKIFSTKNLYCLYLRQKTYIIIKRPFDGRNKTQDFPEYLYSKCKRMRSPKVWKLDNLPKVNMILFIVTVSLIAAYLVFIVLPLILLGSAL